MAAVRLSAAAGYTIAAAMAGDTAAAEVRSSSRAVLVVLLLQLLGAAAAVAGEVYPYLLRGTSSSLDAAMVRAVLPVAVTKRLTTTLLLRHLLLGLHTPPAHTQASTAALGHMQQHQQRWQLGQQ